MKLYLNDRVIEVEDFDTTTDEHYDPNCDVCTSYLEYFSTNLDQLHQFRFTTYTPVTVRDEAGRLIVKIGNDDLEAILEWYIHQMGEIVKYAHVYKVTAITPDGKRHPVLVPQEEDNAD